MEEIVVNIDYKTMYLTLRDEIEKYMTRLNAVDEISGVIKTRKVINKLEEMVRISVITALDPEAETIIKELNNG